MKAADSQAGIAARCPHCGQTIRLPLADEQLLYADQSELIAEPIEPTPNESKQARPGAKHAVVWTIGITIFAGVLIAGMMAGLLLSPAATPPTEDEAARKNDRPADDGYAWRRNDDRESDRPDDSGVLRAVSVQADVFANGGYAPARSKRVYWKVSLTINAGEYTRVFDSAGADAILTIAGKEYESLGSVVDDANLPRRARAERIEIAQGKTSRATLLFEVPAAARAGRLAIEDAGEVAVGPVELQPTVDAGILAGEYVESPPRNLKPLLRNPVMAALQRSANHKLTLARAGDDQWTVRIVPAGVTGSASMVGGILQADIELEGSSLPCKLRPIRDGSGLILYLRDEPFSQITYRRLR